MKIYKIKREKLTQYIVIVTYINNCFNYISVCPVFTTTLILTQFYV